MSRWRRFWSLTAGDKGLLLLAVAAMALAAAAIRLVPLRTIAARLGQPLGAVACVPLATPVQAERARRLRDSIGRATMGLPHRRDCYPQALAGVMLARLLRVPVAMHLGVALAADGAVEAHAWLLSGRIGVTGGAGHERFTPVACFLSA